MDNVGSLRYSGRLFHTIGPDMGKRVPESPIWILLEQRMTLPAGCPNCHPTNTIKALKGKSITFHGFALPKLTLGLPILSLTIKSFRLPRGE